MAGRYSFVVTFKPGRKLDEIKSTYQDPLSEKQKHVDTEHHMSVEVLCTLERHGACFRREKMKM